MRDHTNPLTRFRSNFISYLIAASKDARAIRSSTPRPSTKMPRRKTILSECGLALVAVPWPWAIALKLVRYAKQDPTDCAVVLRLGVAQRGIRWTLAGLEQWIMERCWPMGYTGYKPPQKQQLRQRIQDALYRAFPPGSHGMPVARTTSKTPLYFS